MSKWNDINSKKPENGQHCLVWNNKACRIMHAVYEVPLDSKAPPCWVDAAQGDWDIPVNMTYRVYIVNQDEPVDELVVRHWMPAPLCPYGDSHYRHQPVEKPKK